jgi:hypothetical protein
MPRLFGNNTVAQKTKHYFIAPSNDNRCIYHVRLFFLLPLAIQEVTYVYFG